MSFIGAVAQSVRQVIAAWSKSIQADCVVIGAGNFTVPSSMISGGYTGYFYCCDISIYTSVLGAYLTDATIDIQENPGCPEQLSGLLDMSSPVDMAATVSLLYDLREVWEEKNPYQKRIMQATRSQWQELKAKTVERLIKFKKHLSNRLEYQACDGFDFVDRFDRNNHIVLAYPPTYKGGYEKLEKLLRAAIRWDPPEYRMMTDKSFEIYERISTYSGYIVVLEKDLPEIHAIIGAPSAILSRGRNKKTYIVAKGIGVSPVVMKKYPKSSFAGKILSPDHPVTGNEEISFAPLSLQQTTRLNELYMASHIDYFTSGVTESIGFYLDGHLFGKADFTPSTHQWKIPDGGKMIYLMSDLCVPCREHKLAKLVLICLLSKEIQSFVDIRHIENFDYAGTTAFSHHPVSMKYRGIFKLHSRKQVGKDFSLNYLGRFGAWSIQEALVIWCRKYREKN